MNAVLKTVISLSLSGTLLILALFACKPFFRGKLSKQWQYYVWLIVIARLLLPFTPQESLVGNALQGLEPAASPAQITAVPADEAPAALSRTPHQTASAPTNEAAPIPPWESAAQTPAGSQSRLAPLQDAVLLLGQNLWLCWIFAAFVLFVRKATVYQSFVRYVRAGQSAVEDTRLLDMLAVCGAQAGVKKAVELCRNPLVSSPLIIGFFRPCIVLPDTELMPEQLRYTLLHELTHIRRRDMLYKWLVQCTVCLHWFNPLVHLMAREMDKACELSCDEAVVSTLDAAARRAYAATLLDAMQACGRYKSAPAALSLSENKTILKERLKAIMSFKKTSSLARSMAVAVTVLFCAVAVAAGAYSAPKETQEDKAPYTQRYQKEPQAYIGARAIDGSWAMSTGVHWKDAEGKLESQLEFLETIYREKRQSFIVEEGISADDVTDAQQLQQLYDASETYRKIVTPADGSLYIAPQTDFSILRDGAGTFYERYPFYAAQPGKLELSAAYSLEQGKMKIMLVSPQGEITYQSEMGTRLKQTIVQQIEKGMQSVVLVYEPQGDRVGGSKYIQGKLDASEQAEPEEQQSSIAVDIDACGIELVPTSAGRITADYDPQYYDVRIEQGGGKAAVKVKGKAAVMSVTPDLKLYVPQSGFQLTANVVNGNLTYDMPAGRKDVLDITVKNGGFEMASENRFADDDIVITATEKEFMQYTPVDVPQYFTKDSDTQVSYHGGAGGARVRVTRAGYGSVVFS